MAYIAGFLDADGTIVGYFQKQARPEWLPAFGVNVMFFNQDLEVLEDIRSTLKMGVIRVTRSGYSGVYRLHFTRPETKKVLQRLLPYLRSKRQQAVLALAGMETTGYARNGVPPEVAAYRRDLVAEIQRLNRRHGKAFRTKWVNSGDPSSVGHVADETIPSQAVGGPAYRSVPTEGVTTRRVSPNNTPAHEDPPRKGRDSLASTVM